MLSDWDIFERASPRTKSPTHSMNDIRNEFKYLYGIFKMHIHAIWPLSQAQEQARHVLWKATRSVNFPDHRRAIY